MLTWCAVIAAVAAVAWWRTGARRPDPAAATTAGVVTTPAVLDRFVQEILESGEVESSSNIDIRCEVETGAAGVAILEIVPEGTYVQPGDFLVRLDDADLRSRLVTRQIDVNTTRAALAQAQADLQKAQLELQEYKSGLFREQEEKLESEEFVAKENLRRAEEYLRYSESLAEKGYVSPVQLEADRFALEKASKELEVAKTRLEVLRTFTREKVLTGLEANIETAAARLSATERAHQIDLEQLAVAEAQVALCRIVAPAAGQVVYANDGSTNGERLIEEGKTVRENQRIIRLPDPKRMQVRAEINEARIDQIRPGMTARIRIEALPGGELTGELVKVTEFPLPAANVYVSHIKNYGATVLIDNPPEGLRPGMTAELAILVSEENQALQVPVQSVVERDKRFFCLVGGTAESGPLRAREVELGASNEKNVVIEAGLDEGEPVVLNPSAYIDTMTLPDASELAERREADRKLLARRQQQASLAGSDNPS
jgi:RND family efflux transporter MFP subunit